MSAEILSRRVESHVKAIDLCLENRLGTPALILIYTCIDVMATLSRPALSRKTDKRHFIAWAERHMDCRDRLGVTGLDLYAARCGIVHTGTADSALSEEGRARRISYGWGDRHAGEPMALRQKPGHAEVVLRIEDLAAALRAGIARFGGTLTADPDAAALVERRAGKHPLAPAALSGTP